MNKYLNIMLLLVCACSASPNTTNGPNDNGTPANPCATPGATYLTAVKTVSGNCGDIPSSIINITNDGMVTGPHVSCADVEQDGCRAHDSGCEISQNGCISTFSTDVTFSENGSSASGLESMTIRCNDGSYCSGTYSVSLTRQ